MGALRAANGLQTGNGDPPPTRPYYFESLNLSHVRVDPGLAGIVALLLEYYTYVPRPFFLTPPSPLLPLHDSPN